MRLSLDLPDLSQLWSQDRPFRRHPCGSSCRGEVPVRAVRGSGRPGLSPPSPSLTSTCLPFPGCSLVLGPEELPPPGIQGQVSARGQAPSPGLSGLAPPPLWPGRPVAVKQEPAPAPPGRAPLGVCQQMPTEPLSPQLASRTRPRSVNARSGSGPAAPTGSSSEDTFPSALEAGLLPRGPRPRSAVLCGGDGGPCPGRSGPRRQMCPHPTEWAWPWGPV